MRSDLSMLIFVLLLFRVFLEIYFRMRALSLELSPDLCCVEDYTGNDREWFGRSWKESTHIDELKSVEENCHKKSKL